jgi:anti-sigma B factor antagonist
MQPDPHSLHWEARRVGSSTVLAVTGPIDVATAAAFERALFAALGTAPHVLTIDLRQATHLDSRGVQVLVRTLRRSRAMSVRLRLCVEPDSPMLRLVALHRPPDAFPIVHDC